MPETMTIAENQIPNATPNQPESMNLVKIFQDFGAASSVLGTDLIPAQRGLEPASAAYVYYTADQLAAYIHGTAVQWGQIVGTLSNQTDLQAALDAKANLTGAVFTGNVTALHFIGQYQNLAGSAFINPDGSAVFANGVLTITNAGVISAANLSGTNTGNVSLGTSNGLSLTGQVLSLALATAGAFGAVKVDGTTITATGGVISAVASGGTPGGTDGQVQYNNSGAFAGFTIGGDATLTASTGILLVTKTNGVAFAASATIDTTTAANITSSTNKRFVTDAQLVVIGNTSGTNSGNVTIGTANGLILAGQALSLATASTSVTGALTAADWNTFNGKQPAGSYVTSVGGTASRITSTGGTTPIIDISAVYVGQTSITTLGTIGTGVWNGTAIANANLANSAITIAGTSTSLGGSISQDTITGLSTTGLIKRTGANTLAIAAAGTDYQAPISLTTTGSSGAATFIGNVLNIPQYAGGGGGSGTVTSVAMTGDGVIFNATVSGSPITVSGTLVPALLTQTAATFLAGPATGAAAAPTFRAIATTDVPTLNQNTTGSAAKWTTARNLAGNSVDGSGNVAFANKFIAQGTADAGLSAAQFLGALATGIVKNTTTTGVLSIAVAADFPTLNQNTTGNAATVTNATFTTALTINTGTVTIHGNAANTSALTIGAGAVSVSGANTGDVTIGTANGLSLAGQALSLAAASTSVTGALTSTDWNTFNGKLSPFGSQTANFFYAAPDGAPGTPGFRAIVVADIPTLNQNTTGSAAKWTTARNLAGNSVDGTTNVAFANKFIVQGTADAGLSAAQFLGALATGLLKNTTTTGVLSIAAAGTDYSAGTSALATGILKSTTTTGALTIAVAGDFPTLNQNTTGSAATLTTPRAINGVNFDGSAAITITAAAGTLTGTTLNATVVTSSLTTVGVIGTGTWQGTAVDIAHGGSGQATANAAFNAFAPSQTGNNGKFLTTDGTNTSWGSPAGAGTVTSVATDATLTGGPITSTGTLGLNLANANTWTALQAFNWSCLVLKGSTSGTTMLNAGAIAGTTVLTLPIATDTLVGKATTDIFTNKSYDTAGTGNALKINGTAITAVSGTGAVALVTSPVFVTPLLGTPTSGVLTNCTGYTVANISGLGTGIATFLVTPSSANLLAAVTDETGTGALVFATSPALVTPNFSSIVNTGTLTLPTATDTLVARATTDTLTNKRVTRRFVTTTQAAAPAINTDNTDISSITALAQAITSMTTNLTGTPVAGDMIMIQITDNGTARAITWGAKFASTVNGTLPTTTVISTLLRVLFQWDTVAAVWQCIGVD